MESPHDGTTEANPMRVIRLLEPELCVECRFARIARVETRAGTQRMIHCTRGDCDNWDADTSEAALRVDLYRGQA